MRFAKAAIVALVCTAAAQNRGGMRGGLHVGPQQHGAGMPALLRPPVATPLLNQWSNPFPHPNFPQRPAAIAAGPPLDAPAYFGPPPLFPASAGWMGMPLNPGLGNYALPDPGLAGGWNAPYAYAYSPQPAPQPANPTIMFAPAPSPPGLISPPRIVDSGADRFGHQLANMPVMPMQPSVGRDSAPARESAPPGDYPALIAITNGGIYSATTYWVKGNTFHFITTQGEHMRVPQNSLERVYPPQKNGRPVEPKAPRGQ